jgi:outer membrane protein assembly factor BamD
MRCSFEEVFMKKWYLFLAIGLLALSACTKDRDEYNPYEGMTAKQLFIEAEQNLAKKQYSSASKRLEAMESMYPFSEYAQKSEMYLIFAYYKAEDYPSAAATAERFIHLYPRAAHVDYAYYMKGLANFKQARGVFANMFPLNESWRDPGTQAQAYSDFATLVQTFPQSRYRANALQRMIYLRNMFAERELNAANYYFGRKRYVAALERANTVVKNYPQAPSAARALVIMRESNRILGLRQAAEEANTVKLANYPQTRKNRE